MGSRKIVCHYLETDTQKVSKETSFVDGPKDYALALTEPVLVLEDEFDLDVDGKDFEKTNTFGGAVRCISDKVSLGI